MNVFVAHIDDEYRSLIGVYSSLENVEAGLLDYVSLPDRPGAVELVGEIDQFRRYRITGFTVDPPDIDEATVEEIGLDA